LRAAVRARETAHAFDRAADELAHLVQPDAPHDIREGLLRDMCDGELECEGVHTVTFAPGRDDGISGKS
jgi:hypothetical protein